jgi:hypothetical protein
MYGSHLRSGEKFPELFFFETLELVRGLRDPVMTKKNHVFDAEVRVATDNDPITLSAGP